LSCEGRSSSTPPSLVSTPTCSPMGACLRAPSPTNWSRLTASSHRAQPRSSGPFDTNTNHLLPYVSFRRNLKRHAQNICKDTVLAIYEPMIYKAPFAFDVGKSMTRASGRGLGPGNRDFFGPSQMASSRLANAILGPKKS
jgi:hypothetical protein